MADAESTSTIVLENAAKLVETSNPARSAELYTKLSKIYKVLIWWCLWKDEHPPVLSIVLCVCAETRAWFNV
jgi:hypothetical protein